MVSALRGHARPRTRSSTILAGSVPDVETSDPNPNTRPPSQHHNDFTTWYRFRSPRHIKRHFVTTQERIRPVFDQQRRIIQPLNPPTSGSADAPEDASARRSATGDTARVVSTSSAFAGSTPSASNNASTSKLRTPGDLETPNRPDAPIRSPPEFAVSILPLILHPLPLTKRHPPSAMPSDPQARRAPAYAGPPQIPAPPPASSHRSRKARVGQRRAQPATATTPQLHHKCRSHHTAEPRQKHLQQHEHP